MNTIDLMLATLNKQIYSGCKIYLVTLERPDCRVLEVTLNKELTA